MGTSSGIGRAVTSGGTHGPLSRRRIVRGAAWSVPVVVVGTAAHSFASSQVPPACDPNTGSQTWTVPTATPITFTVPAVPECDYVYFEIVGGEGGLSATSGKGAKFTGTFVRPTRNAFDVDLVVGGGGQAGQSSAIWSGGLGYGKGGDTQTAPSKAYVPIGAGGGGSALALAGQLAGSPLVVAGGGGGGNWEGGNGPACTATDGGWTVAGVSPGHGGLLDGATAEQGRLIYISEYNNPANYYYTLSVNGGHGAAGASGGAGGAGGTGTLYPASPYAANQYNYRRYSGQPGQARGSGANGGGNGGKGAQPWGGADVGSRTDLIDWMTSGAGGGGGFAGGGGGSNGWLIDLGGCVRRYTASGGGGGGSSFAGSGVTIATSGLGAASNGLPGAHGSVLLRW